MFKKTLVSTAILAFMLVGCGTTPKLKPYKELNPDELANGQGSCLNFSNARNCALLTIFEINELLEDITDYNFASAYGALSLGTITGGVLAHDGGKGVLKSLAVISGSLLGLDSVVDSSKQLEIYTTALRDLTCEVRAYDELQKVDSNLESTSKLADNYDFIRKAKTKVLLNAKTITLTSQNEAIKARELADNASVVGTDVENSAATALTKATLANLEFEAKEKEKEKVKYENWFNNLKNNPINIKQINYKSAYSAPNHLFIREQFKGKNDNLKDIQNQVDLLVQSEIEREKKIRAAIHFEQLSKENKQFKSALEGSKADSDKKLSMAVNTIRSQITAKIASKNVNPSSLINSQSDRIVDMVGEIIKKRSELKQDTNKFEADEKPTKIINAEVDLPNGITDGDNSSTDAVITVESETQSAIKNQALGFIESTSGLAAIFRACSAPAIAREMETTASN